MSIRLQLNNDIEHNERSTVYGDYYIDVETKNKIIIGSIE